MSRGLCVLAALAILASGCASRRAVDRLESDVGRLRSELAEMRLAQQVTSRDISTVNQQLQGLDIKSLGDNVAQLSRRADAAEAAMVATQAKIEALASQPAPAISSNPAPSTSSNRAAASVPAPLPPGSTPLPQSLAPGVPDPAVMSPGQAPQAPAPTAGAPSSAAAPPPAAVMSPAPAPVPAAPPTAAGERARVAPPPAPTPPAASTPAPAPNIARAPTPQAATPPMTPPSSAPARPAPKTGGNPEQEYAAALATYRAREHGQAVLDFVDFIAKYPKHPLAGNAQYWIGEAYWAQRDYRQALVEFEKVFEHGSAKAPDALLKIGLCHIRLNDVPRAQTAWQRVVNEYPKSEPAAMARSLLATHSSASR
jgi:tol-pal system protein YbgF